MKRVLENNRSPKQYNQGAVLVELAIVLPLLTLLLVVIIDLGLVLWEHQVASPGEPERRSGDESKYRYQEWRW